jgi:Tfp pilus assembly protein PilO
VFYQKPVTKVSSALLLTIFTIIFFAAFAIRPTLTTVAELLKKIQDQEEVLTGLKEKSASLAQAQQEYMAVQDKLVAIDNALPQDVDADGIITQVEATTADNQLALNGFAVGDIEYKPHRAPQKSGLQNQPINLNLLSTYTQLKTYLDNIINIPRLVNVTNISFGPPNNSPEQSEDLNLTVSMQAFFLPKESESTP